MKTSYLILISLFVFLYSCQANKNTETATSSPYVINLDSVSQDAFKYSSLFSKVNAIVLDNQDVLLNEISKLLRFDNKLFVLDSQAKALYVFDLNGAFIRQVGSLGPGPGEYSTCTDFTINTDNGEIFILDSMLKKIFKYDSGNGRFMGNIRLDNQCDIDRIFYRKDYIYGTKASFISLSMPATPMLYQLNATSGKLEHVWLDSNRHNKGWQGEYTRHNLFYPINDKCLFTMGFMDTIMAIGDTPVPYVKLESKGFVTEEDVNLMKEQDNMLAYIRMFQYNMSHNKVQNICDVFEYKEHLYFSFQRYSRHQVCYNKATNETAVYNQIHDDVLYDEMPSNRVLFKFLLADEGGVYYASTLDYLEELSHFVIDAKLGSEKFVNKDVLKDIDHDSNPVILYYEFKD